MIKIVGAPLEECRHRFVPHQSYESQLNWKRTGEAAFERLRRLLNSKNSGEAAK